MDENKIFMSCQKVAELLRKKVNTVYSWIHYKMIPEKIYRKIGNTPLFIREEVIKWIMDDGAKMKKRPR